MTETPRPLTLLVSAIGGEGGGVLAQWIVDAARIAGFPVQSTSIPGVAQRTGATTYYIELFPVSLDALGDRRPVFALYPGVGDLDVMLASEFAEAARAVARGFVTPDRTLLIASTHRVYAIDERSAAGDGRVAHGRLAAAVRSRAQRVLADDLRRLAARAGVSLNAVLLGVLAGSGAVPVPRDSFEAAIRTAGISVDANLHGFELGFGHQMPDAIDTPPPDAAFKRAAPKGPVALLRQAQATFPALAHPVLEQGVGRLVHYQGVAYAARYLARLEPVWQAESNAGGDGRLVAEAARHLAVRMSYEDVIRVAQLKASPERLARVRTEVGADRHEPVVIVDYFKPGIDELASILPPLLARPLLKLSDRRGWRGTVHFGMKVKATTIFGHARLRLLAALRYWRPFTWRYQEEQRAIEQWLADMIAAIAVDLPLAREIAASARLLKGYGDTHRRSSAAMALIRERVIVPALDGRLPPAHGIDALASAVVAAMADDKGKRLSAVLDAVGTSPLPAADGQTISTSSMSKVRSSPASG